MNKIQTLDKIALDYFSDLFMDLSCKSQLIVIEIQRNQILSSTYELKLFMSKKPKSISYIDDDKS